MMAHLEAVHPGWMLTKEFADADVAEKISPNHVVTDEIVVKSAGGEQEHDWATRARWALELIAYHDEFAPDHELWGWLRDVLRIHSD